MSRPIIVTALVISILGAAALPAQVPRAEVRLPAMPLEFHALLQDEHVDSWSGLAVAVPADGGMLVAVGDESGRVGYAFRIVLNEASGEPLFVDREPAEIAFWHEGMRLVLPQRRQAFEFRAADGPVPATLAPSPYPLTRIEGVAAIVLHWGEALAGTTLKEVARGDGILYQSPDPGGSGGCQRTCTVCGTGGCCSCATTDPSSCCSCSVNEQGTATCSAS